MPLRPLPDPPTIHVSVVRDRTAESRPTGGFLDLSRFDLRVRYADGTESPAFAYDMTTRKALDAVVIAAHFTDAGVRHVYLRSAVRPPCAMRAIGPLRLQRRTNRVIIAITSTRTAIRRKNRLQAPNISVRMYVAS